MTRYDQNASLWSTRTKAARMSSHRIVAAGIGGVVALIAVHSLVGLVATAPASVTEVCRNGWHDADARCGQPPRLTVFGGAAQPMAASAALREAGPADGAHTRAVEMQAVPAPAAGATAASTAAATDGRAPREPARMPAVKIVEAPAATETPIPATAPLPERSDRVADSRDGEPAVDTARSASPILQLSEHDLTFKTGAVHRPGAKRTAGKKSTDEAARDATPAKVRKNARNAGRVRSAPLQVQATADGRRVTAHRSDGRTPRDGDGGSRVRAAEIGGSGTDSFFSPFGRPRPRAEMRGLY